MPETAGANADDDERWGFAAMAEIQDLPVTASERQV